VDDVASSSRSLLGCPVITLLRTRVMTGLVTILPVLITFWVVRFIFRIMRDASRWAVEALLVGPHGSELLAAMGLIDPGKELETLESMPAPVHWAIAIVSVILTVLVLYVVGALAANVAGRRVVAVLDTLAGRVPLVKSVYRASKQVLSAFSGDRAHSYLGVALVPFPNESMRAIGFVTSRFEDARTGEELVSIFIPSTPNPTTGFLEIVRGSDLEELDWSLEDTLAAVMSGGTLRPTPVTLRTAAPTALPRPMEKRA